MANKTICDEYPLFKKALSIIGLDVQKMKFTKTGFLKEFCINGIWYVINMQKKFTAFLREIIDKPISKVSRKIPKWLSLHGYVKPTTYWKTGVTIH